MTTKLEQLRMSIPAGVGVGDYLESLVGSSNVFEVRSVIEIDGSDEPLVEIPSAEFLFFEPHPYIALNAPYGAVGPYFLREGVVSRLSEAANNLDRLRPGYRFKIFDGYRPLPVQQFMVDYTMEQVAIKEGITRSPDNEERLLNEALKLFARPERDPLKPPPHSTGAAVDLTIVDEMGCELEMGSEIDAMPPEALPGHYRQSGTELGMIAHRNRSLLNEVMRTAGFRRLHSEWWHFSFGDQYWAMVESLESGRAVSAIYGRVG